MELRHRCLAWAVLAAAWANHQVADQASTGGGQAGSQGPGRASTWEWAAVFDFPESGHFVWTVTRDPGGAYAEPSVRMVIVPTASASAVGMEEAEATVEALWHRTASEPAAGEYLLVGWPNVMRFDERSWATHFKLHVDQPCALALFLEHPPAESERGSHYLRSARGRDVEPGATVFVGVADAGGHTDNHHGRADDHSHSNDHGHGHADDHTNGHNDGHDDGHDDVHGDGHDDNHADGHDGDHRNHVSHNGHDNHEDHEGHTEHGEHGADHCPWSFPWQWAAGFSVDSPGDHTWNVMRQIPSGDYNVASMRIIFAFPGDSTEELADAEEEARALWATPHTTLKSGEEIELGRLYTLTFDQDLWISSFIIPMASSGRVAVFAEFDPSGFDSQREFGFMRNSAGMDLESSFMRSAGVCPAAQGGGSDIFEVLLGSFITCVPSMVAIAFLAFQTHGGMQKYQRTVEPVINAFASGVISGAAVFLLMPESTHLAFAGLDEVTGAWTWGVALLGGWLSGVLISHASDVITEHFFKSSGDAADGLFLGGNGAKPTAVGVVAEDAASSSTNTPSLEPDRIKSWPSIAGPVIFGDAFHNLSDGFVVGVAFRNCSRNFAWGMVGVTSAHELPQELADFVILVNKAGMRWYTAVLANFLSSLSTLVGAVIAYQLELHENSQGLVLAVGAGVYLYVAMTELGPNMKDLGQGKWEESLTRLVPFVLGAACMGLVLLGHEHCGADDHGHGDEGDAHAGHGH